MAKFKIDADVALKLARGALMVFGMVLSGIEAKKERREMKEEIKQEMLLESQNEETED